MGWSCSSAAGARLDAISSWMVANGNMDGSQNSWKDSRTGERYFFESSRREHSDGAITGSIWKFVNDTQVVKSGSFKIERDGRISRGPALFKNIPAYHVVLDGFEHRWDIAKQGEANEDNLWKYVRDYVKSFEVGGHNHYVSKATGKIPYPSSAKLVCLNDGKTVAEWKAGIFQVWN